MAMTLADIRAKYPDAYKGVDDATLADAIYKKHYPTADRREFDARIGLKPYDSALTTAGKALQGVPGNLQIGISGVTQQLAEGEAGDPNALIERIAKPDFRISQRPDIDEASLIQWGRQKLGLDTSTPLTPEQTAQIEGLAKAPGGREEFGQYLLSGAGLGTNPKRVALADIKGQLERAEINKGIPQLDVAPGSVESVIGNVVSSTAQMAPGYAASLLTRNPGPAVALAEVLTSSQAYAEARDAGVSPDKAAQYAMANGFAEAVGEALPLSMILKEGSKLIPKLFKAGVSEALQEGVTQLIQSGLQSGTISPDMTWKDVRDQIIAAAAAGATAGVLLGGATSALDTATGKTEKPTAESVSAEVLAKPENEAPIEESTAPPTQTMLALPSPESFAQPDIKRRQPQLQATEEPSPVVENADYQARIALKRTRQEETAALLQTAKETVTPLGTFSPEDIGGEAAGRVKALRIQTGRPVEAPVTIEELARAKVPQKQIDAIITARRPMAQAEALSPLDITRSAAAKNIIATDSNFKDLAYRTTGQRDTSRMTQAQLNALKTTIDALPAHPAPVTVPLAEAPSFTDDQYGKALDALRKQGRYTEKAIKDVTGLKTTKDVHAIRDALVRRGQLVQRSPNDFRLYDVVGQEKQAVPADLPPGAFKEHVVTRLPVSRTRIRKDGTLLPDSFGSASEVREKISTIRESESKAGGRRSALKIEPAADVAYGVMENRYDEAGNLLGQVVVDTHRNESDARASADKLNKVTDAVEQPSAKPLPVRKPPPPAVLAGRMKTIVTNLNQLARSRALPLLGTRVQLVDSIETPGGAHAEGRYLQQVIQIALSHLDPKMTDAELVSKLAEVMDHELIHALSRAGVLGPNTDGWHTIARYARKAKRPGENETYFEWADRIYGGGKVPGYNTIEDVEEEAIAEAFRHWAAARRNVTGKPGTVFAQLVEYIKRLLRAIPHDLFVSIESGSLVADALRPPGSNQPRARAVRDMTVARAGVAAAETAKDENLVKVKGREFLRARAQAREDRLGRSGPKTVIGTTPTKAYATGAVMNREGVAALADKYRTETGISAGRLMTLLPEDMAYLQRVADAQQRGVHAPKADDVAKAYRALADETRAMWRALGPVQVTAWTGESPPYASPAEMFDDLAAGKLRLRLSKDMFGEGADNPGHPMYEASGYKTVDGKDLVLNDLFRVVHDVYGHGQSGFRDDPRGQYNAYHEHARLLSPEARRALATETLAQSAWANYGPHLRRRDGTVPRETDVDYLAPTMKEFAEQKAFLVPTDLLDADPGWAIADQAEQVEESKFSKFDESLPGGHLYGNPNRSPGGALSKPETPNPAFTADRPGNRFFGGEMADHQLDMARTGARGATLIYMTPEDFLALTGAPPNPEQEVYDEAVRAGYKFSTLPSLVIEGYAGNVRATSHDGAYAAQALMSPSNKLAHEMVRFADQNGVDAAFQPLAGGGLELTDLFARTTGAGAGTTVMQKLVSLADAAGVNLYLHPSEPRNKTFYSRFGFGPSKKFGMMERLAAFDIDAYYANEASGTGEETPTADQIPVVLYPKKGESLGLVTALEGNGTRVSMPPRQENYLDMRGPRYSVGSPEFQRWFGDSKVVKPDGSPRVVYHGSPAANLTTFDKSKIGVNSDPGDIGRGFYFTPNFPHAMVYTGRTDDDTRSSSRVVQAFLSLQNPLTEMAPDFLAAVDARVAAVPAPAEGRPGWTSVGPSPEGAAITARAQAITDEARARGYDGVMMDNPRYGYPEIVAFEPTQIKSAIANKGTWDAANPDIRYSLTAPFGARVPATPPGPMRNIVQQRTEGMIGRAISAIGRSKREVLGVSIFDARVKLQDKMLSIKEMIEDIKENGGDITDLNDTYMLEQLYHGKVFEQIKQRETELQLPLLNALKAAHDGPLKVQPKQFEDYLYARHAPERNAYLRARGATQDNPSGMSDAEASAILDRFALDGKLPALEHLAALADRITADTTQTRVDAGLISEAAARSSPYQYYVPLRGFAEEDLDPGEPTENQTRARSGKGFSVGGREDRTVTGRERKAGDILGHLFLQNTEAVIRGEKNAVALSFMRLLQDNPDAGYGQILATAPTRRVVGPNGMIHEAGDPTYRQQPDIVTAKWKGKEVIARVVDPRLARAIKSDYVTTSNDLVNGLVNLAGKLNRYLATVNTSLNPEFLISNLARDMQTAGILSAQYDIPGFGRKIIGNAPKAMGGIRAVLRGGDTTGPWAHAFLEMQAAGGTTEFLGIHDLETKVQAIRNSVTRTGLAATPRKVMDYLGNVLQFVDDYNKVAENAFRLSAYVAAREAGTSVPQAAFLAKNLTVNFNKGGELKGFLNAMYLFYNASTQGTAVLMNGLKNKRVQRIVGGVVIAGVLQDIINRVLSGDDDDNGVPDYDDIPDYVLQTNFVLMDPLGILRAVGVKQGYFSLPMPYGFNAFYNMGRNLSAGFSGSPVRNPAKSAADSLGTFVDAFNPLGGVQSIWNFIAPTFADPVVDLITNKDFAGNPIVPERPSFGLPVPDSQKYWSNISEIPKSIAAQVNALTGGNEVRKGAVDVSPETLQYIFDYATGASGKFVTRLGGLVAMTPKLLAGDFSDVQIGDIPFARRVVGSINERANTARYYEVAKEVKTVGAEMKMYEDDGNMEAMRAEAAKHPVEVRLLPLFDDAENDLADLRKEIRDVRDHPTMAADRKAEIVKRLQDEQNSIMRQLNRIYFASRK